MSLNFLSIGEKAKIVGINGRPQLRKHLIEIGFALGRTIEVVQHTFGNNIIVAVGGSRIALDRKMTQRIDISLEREEADGDAGL